jgi:release factor glutamine methyltransferase
MMLADSLRHATALLEAVSDTPRLDAELLLAHALEISRDALLLGAANGRHVPAAFDGLIERRLAHEPIAYILGERDFWTLSLNVGPGVLIPRPDSETLIEAAIAFFNDRQVSPRSILDLGTGSGALLLAALDHWRHAFGLGIDQSEVALGFARANAVRNGAVDRAEFRLGNWCTGIEHRFDLILCNPPYVESEAELSPQVRAFEPASALFAGPDGLDDYRVLIPQLSARLNKGGVAVLEIGAGQALDVAAIAQAAGFEVQARKDLGGHDRALVLSPALFSCKAPMLFSCKDGVIG